GRSYFVMELLDGGRSLEADLKNKEPMLPARALPIAVQIASALAAAHVKGIIHRDLKPANVHLVPRSHTPDFVKLLDFGIAKLMDTASDGVTRAGMIMGTPTYMSPEQATGDPIDARSDIYSFGIILFQMVCGRTPFRGESLPALIQQHLNVAPPAPRSVNPALTVSLERVILRCLAKKREDRYQSMGEVVEALKVELAGLSMRATARPVARPPRPTMEEEPTRVARSGDDSMPPVAVALGSIAPIAPIAPPPSSVPTVAEERRTDAMRAAPSARMAAVARPPGSIPPVSPGSYPPQPAAGLAPAASAPGRMAVVARPPGSIPPMNPVGVPPGSMPPTTLSGSAAEVMRPPSAKGPIVAAVAAGMIVAAGLGALLTLRTGSGDERDEGTDDRPKAARAADRDEGAADDGPGAKIGASKSALDEGTDVAPDEAKDVAKGAVKDGVKGAAKDEAKGDAKDEAKDDAKDEAKGDAKDEAKDAAKDEAKDVAKDVGTDETKDAVKASAEKPTGPTKPAAGTPKPRPVAADATKPAPKPKPAIAAVAAAKTTAAPKAAKTAAPATVKTSPFGLRD
ncbi:MAG TPA: protein kinase, partial [Myxococcota bacterium]|nr:protein kinase [Myxococcota bacterium]